MKYSYIVWGKVKKGKGRGKILGFPTANFPLHKIIKQGIYISQAKVLNKIYPSVTFIGNAKTYGESQVKVETYILDFNKNIYGLYLSVKILNKLRENKKFKNEKELIAQMKKDLKKIKKYFTNS